MIFNKLKTLIITDDFTGACDMAGFFCGLYKYIDVHLEISSANKNLIAGSCIVLINTQTRTKNAKKAFDIISNLGSVFFTDDFDIVFKKIDTAFRGNISSEINAIMNFFRARIVCVINSIPRMNRITVGGYQLIDGKLLEDHEFSNDVNKKIDRSRIIEILNPGLNYDIGYIGISDIRKGIKSIVSSINKEISKGFKVIIFDSVIQDDIDNILTATKKIKEKILWAGSLGLVESISNFLKYNYKVEVYKNSDIKELPCKVTTIGLADASKIKKIIGISGSFQSKSKSQNKFLFEGNNVIPVEIEVSNILDDVMVSNYKEILIENIKRKFEKNNIMLIIKSDQVIEKKFGHIYISGKIIEFLSILMKDIIKRNIEFERLVLVGGETAFNILKSLEVKFVRITGIIEIAVNVGIAFGGFLNNKEVIIKGGSVGSLETVHNMFNSKFSSILC